MKQKFILLASILSAITFFSCDKTENLSVAQTENSQLINEEQVVESMSTDIDAITDEALSLKLPSNFRSAAIDTTNYLGSCPIISLDSTKTTKVLTVDFGSGCIGKDGKTRSGKIIVTSSNFSKITGVLREVSFSNYTINGDTIGGSIKKTIVLNLDLYKRKAYIDENILIKRKNNGGTAKRIAEMYRIYDINRPAVVRDDKIIIWGNSQFTNAKGTIIVKNVTELKPLIYKVSCHQIVSGIEVVYKSNKTITIDFGDGTCDDVATATDGTNTWTIKL